MNDSLPQPKWGAGVSSSNGNSTLPHPSSTCHTRLQGPVASQNICCFGLVFSTCSCYSHTLSGSFRLFRFEEIQASRLRELTERGFSLERARQALAAVGDGSIEEAWMRDVSDVNSIRCQG